MATTKQPKTRQTKTSKKKITPTKNAEQFEYKAEMKQLLHLIVHSLYTHPEVFLRELISNASDALNKIRFQMLTDTDVLDPDADLRITVELDTKTQTFSIEDSGGGVGPTVGASVVAAASGVVAEGSE